MSWRVTEQCLGDLSSSVASLRCRRCRSEADVWEATSRRSLASLTPGTRGKPFPRVKLKRQLISERNFCNPQIKLLMSRKTRIFHFFFNFFLSHFYFHEELPTLMLLITLKCAHKETTLQTLSSSSSGAWSSVAGGESRSFALPTHQKRGSLIRQNDMLLKTRSFTDCSVTLPCAVKINGPWRNFIIPIFMGDMKIIFRVKVTYIDVHWPPTSWVRGR